MEEAGGAIRINSEGNEYQTKYTFQFILKEYFLKGRF
jgi:hypothetical protein